ADVTDSYDISYANGTLEVTKKAVKITADSDAKVYDATELTKNSYTNSELAEGDSIESVTITGSQTVKGISANVPSEAKIVNANGADVTDSYDISYANGTLEVTKKTVKITADSDAKVYDATELTKNSYTNSELAEGDSIESVTITGSQTVKGISANVPSEAKIVNADGADVTDSYDISYANGTLEVTKKAITLTIDAKSKIYGDTDPEFTASFGEGDLAGDDVIDYELSRIEGENAGSYQISTTIENDNYDVKVVPADLTINKKAITLTVDAKSKTYGDDDPAFTASFGEGDLVGNDTIDYELGRKAGEDAGTYEISTAIEHDNYVVTVVPADLTINKKAITLTVDPKTKTYGEVDPEFTASFGEGDLVGDDTIEVKLTREPGEDAGTYEITTSITNSNYDVTVVPATLAVLPVAEVHVKITAHGDEFTYDAQDHRVTGYDVEIDNTLYTEADILFSGIDTVTARNAGTYSMGLTAADFTNISNNFERVVFEVENRNVVIAPKAATITVDNKTKTYGDEDPTLTASVEGLAGADAVIPMLSREDGSNVGTYAISAEKPADRNYIFTIVPGTLTITPKAITVTANDKIKVFGEEDPDLSATITGLVNGDSEDLIQYTLEREEGEDAGIHRITATGETEQGNYTVTFEEAEMTIAPEDSVVVRIAANNGTFLYDGTEHDLSGFSIVSISNSLYSENAFTFTGNSDLKAVNAGIYRTNMTADDFVNNDPNFTNVLFEVENGELVITKRQVTLTSADDEKTYDGTALKNNTITVGGDGFAPNEGANFNVTGQITNVGKAANTFDVILGNGTLAANYDFTKTFGTLTVLPGTIHKLHIRYVNEAGEEIRNFEREYAPGEKYEVVTPHMPGYTADIETVAGTMGDNDIEVTVTYSHVLYTLTIHYPALGTDEDVMEPTVVHLPAGSEYRIEVPEAEGYTAMIDVVTGTMPVGDREISVIMVSDELKTGGILRNGDPVLIIEDERTALGISNAVLGSGEIIE
ncbi:MAG: MucBP domain-containing protein, partial [Clostridia bacterium]|nr:MucBP domain-containing protein [Clostridia bacterium]